LPIELFRTIVRTRKVLTSTSWIDVEKSAYHQLSQIEIASDNPCSQQLSGDNEEIGDPTRLAGSNRPE